MNLKINFQSLNRHDKAPSIFHKFHIMVIDTELSQFSEIPSKEEGERTTREEWAEIFELLDTKDGQSDGYIHRDTFLEWIDTLSFQDSISLEAERGISR